MIQFYKYIKYKHNEGKSYGLTVCNLFYCFPMLNSHICLSGMGHYCHHISRHKILGHIVMSIWPLRGHIGSLKSFRYSAWWSWLGEFGECGWPQFLQRSPLVDQASGEKWLRTVRLHHQGFGFFWTKTLRTVAHIKVLFPPTHKHPLQLAVITNALLKCLCYTTWGGCGLK